MRHAVSLRKLLNTGTVFLNTSTPITNRARLAFVSLDQRMERNSFRANRVVLGDGKLCIIEGRMETIYHGKSDDELPAEKAAVPNGKQSSRNAGSPIKKTSRFRRLLGLEKKCERAEKIWYVSFFLPELL